MDNLLQLKLYINLHGKLIFFHLYFLLFVYVYYHFTALKKNFKKLYIYVQVVKIKLVKLNYYDEKKLRYLRSFIKIFITL